MKKLLNLAKLLVVIFLVTTLNNACTNLDEDYGSTISPDAYLQIKVDATKSLQEVYGKLSAFGGSHNSAWSDNEVSSDELMIPQRGGDWFDGGQWLRMHRHEFTPGEESFKNAFANAYGAIAACNRLLIQIPAQDAVIGAQVEPELRAIRAMYYYYLLDMWGNVPLITKYPGDIAQAATKSRADIFNFVKSEFEYAKPKLSKSKTYGKLNYWSVQGYLAKLYLNAGVYTGTPQWQAAADACSDIISGPYAMEKTDYYNNFKSNNEASTENIFVIPYDEVTLKGFNLAQMTLHYESQQTFNLNAKPWNGYCSLQEFYNSYDAADKRKANFLVGQQFASDGVTKLVDASAETNDPDGQPLNFTPAINQQFPGCLRQAGARVGKFKYALLANPDLNNDFPLIRLGDVKLMRAEALYRLSAASPEALTLVNEIRTRAGVPAFAALTDDNLLAERGREMFAEGVRRTDMIRFGKFFKPYDAWKPSNDDATKGIFPLPQTQIEANIQLVQNPGYPK
jgi:SusD family/Starch-binding associating with outer membrane